MKKEYGSPELEKLALEDEDLERVSGGAGEDGGSAGNIDIGVIGSDSMGNIDIDASGRGGGCDIIPPLHRSARTFSSGRNSNCWEG
jgi:hypothetical protein